MRVSIVHPNATPFMQAIAAARAAEPARTGLHLSTIVGDIVARTMPGRDDGAIDEATGWLFQEIGNTWENIVAADLGARYSRFAKPRPRVYRGIICSPDGDDGTTIHEIKARWGSCREFIEVDGEAPDFRTPLTGELTGESATFVKYKLQLLFYMRAFGRSRGQLHSIFLAGDFRPPFPRPATIRLRPTPDELDTVEEQIVGHAIDMGWLSRKDAQR